MLRPASEAVDLMALTSRTADLFVEQVGGEQRKLLHLVLQGASWKGGELRISPQEPFQQLQLSNSVNRREHDDFDPNEPNFDNWRRDRDSNPG